MRRPHRVEVQQRVAQREAGIDRVARRAAIAAGEVELAGEQRAEAVKIGTRGAALDAAQGGAVLRGRSTEPGQRRVELRRRIEQRLAQVRPLAEGRVEESALAADLGDHEVAGPAGAERRIGHMLALGQPDGGIVVGRAEHDRHLPAGPRAEQQGGHAGLGQLDQRAGVEPRACALQHHALEQLDRHGGAASARLVDRQCAVDVADFKLGAV